MELEVTRKGKTTRVRVNRPTHGVPFPFEGERVGELKEVKVEESYSPFEKGERGILVKVPLSLDDHVFGLGEKAFPLDRKRTRLTTWNVDAGGAFEKYGWHIDPMYVSVPFFVLVSPERVRGFFFNSPSKVVFDFGLLEYDKINVFVPDDSLEFFYFQGESFEEILEEYVKLTGKPFLLPEWAMGYQISRFSYFPQEAVIEVVKRHLREGFKVTAVYLDIHYMDEFKAFTWDKERFPEPKRMAEELHSMGVKLITILNPCVKVDQRYPVFKEAVQREVLVESEKGIYVGEMWPGNCAWVDFLNPEAREWWKEKVREWAREFKVDGIWLDMNEPTDLSRRDKYLTLRGAKHRTEEGEVDHERVRNAYPYFQSMATYEALKEAGLTPFILSRSGYSGIQRFSAVWTGDNYHEWDDLRLQTTLALGLSISGIPYVGCDIGGWNSRNEKSPPDDLELLTRYFEVALFFPLFRSHKNISGMDQEPYNLPSVYRERVKYLLDLRYKFLPYLLALAREAHETGHPVLRPLVYKYWKDREVYAIDDEYLVGDSILYAPYLKKERERLVYLPEGKWADFWEDKVYEGRRWIEVKGDRPPIFMKFNSLVPLDAGDGELEVVAFGEGRIKLYSGITLRYEGGELKVEGGEVKVRKVTVKG